MKYTAIYTERPGPKLAADIIVIFALRDALAQDDVEGTRANLDAQGLFPHLRDFDRLAEIPEELDLSVPVEPAPLPPPSTLNPQPSTSDDLPPAQVQAIHDCLHILAGHCDGARSLDGAGFNKMDTEFGHSLANASKLTQKQARAGMKLLHKYHRQLPQALLDQALTGAGAIAHCGAGLATDMGTDQSVGQIHADGSTPAQLVNAKYSTLKPGPYGGTRLPKSGDEVAGNGCEEPYGDTYQNGVKPGPKKLAQFIEVLQLTGTPALYAQDGKGDEAMVHVKLFDPCGSWTCYLTEFSETAPDGCKNLAFGLVTGVGEPELGYVDLEEISNVRGRMGIGIEIDMHFKPTTLGQLREKEQAVAA